MMFSHAIALAIAARPLLATAIPLLDTRQNCSTGALHCCQSTANANSVAGSAILSLLGIVVQDANVLVGLTCSPFTLSASAAATRAPPTPSATRTTAT
ncbi:hypothetical protein BD414DRAFT_580645 [Trametes punicea]|nr:hypothetical protein BD414DRAFT_580645 [Trametes punicea]